MIKVPEKPPGALRVLALGDVVGAPGRGAVSRRLPTLRREVNADLVVVNSENSAGGAGLDPQCGSEIRSAGADVITLGDHTWARASIKGYLEENTDFCIRPANYPEGVPGRGWTVWTSPSGVSVGVMNLLGRVFIGGALDCPFRKADELLEGPLNKCDLVVLDLHAEASSEKIALGRYLDGHAQLVFGTHTHVQTADETILPRGTAFITDIGMSGPTEGVLGMKTSVSIDRFLTGMRVAYDVEKGPSALHGIICDLDPKERRAVAIHRFRDVAPH